MWMLGEGLIRARNVRERDEQTAYFSDVQLTSKGIAILQSRTNDDSLGETVEETFGKTEKGELTPDVYAKIGSFVGAAAGGFIQSLG